MDPTASDADLIAAARGGNLTAFGGLVIRYQAGIRACLAMRLANPHEAEDLAKAFQTLAASDDPYDVWFREHLVSVHGMSTEMLAGPIPATLFFVYRAAGGAA